MGGSAPTAAQTRPHDDDAQARIEEAWGKAEALNRYEFRSQLTQLTFPEPSVANAGRPPQESELGITGTLWQQEGRLETTLWSDLSFDPERGASMLVENGQAFVQDPETNEWVPADDMTQSVAPGGDPFSFLAGLSHVQAMGRDTRTVAGVTTTFDQYSFELNSGAFASYVERETARMVAENGDLPYGMSPGPNEKLRNMVGTGQIWLDEQGYIARIDMDIKTDLEEGGEFVEARLVTDFFGFVADETAVPPTFMTAPLQRIGIELEAAAHPENASVVGWTLLSLVLLVLLAVFVWRQAHTKEFYTTVVSLIIFAMVFPPLLHAREAQAFFEDEFVTSQEREVAQAEYEAQEK